MSTIDNQRIAKNTLFLYIRMLLIMLVTLYTSRVVLTQLGILDYGIFNVVAGIVSMLSFLNSSMSLASQRFFAVDIGRQEIGHLNKTFSMAINIHAIIAIITVILAETVGIWLFNKYLNIPANRFSVAKAVYHIAIIQTVIGIMTVPFTSLIISYENMKIYAYISIIEVVLKLFVAFALIWITFEKLTLYAILLAGVSFSILLVWLVYCNIKFPQCRYHIIWEKSIFKDIFSFTGWQTLGTITWLLRTQGVNFIMNIFFGPIVNAARGIAVQVNAALMQLVSNFQMASNPQITKYYANEDYSSMYQLIIRSSKISFLLMMIIAVPILFKTESILIIWLGQVPPYSVIFVRLMVISTLSELLSGTMVYGALASGKIKTYQISISSILIFEVLLVYGAYKIGFSPQYAFYIEIFLYIIALFARLVLLQRLIGLPPHRFMKEAIYRELSAILICCVSIMLFNRLLLTDNVFNLFVYIISSIIICGLIAFVVGLNNSERKWIQQKTINIINSIQK